MPLERQLGSSIAASVRSLLEGDFAASAAVMDWLQEYRPEDLSHFRLMLGHLAAATFARGGAIDETTTRGLGTTDWAEFRHGLTAMFWFELFTPDSTWASLTEACVRMKAAGPRPFGFAGS